METFIDSDGSEYRLRRISEEEFAQAEGARVSFAAERLVRGGESEAEARAREIDALVEMAVVQGRIDEAQRENLRRFAEADLRACTEHLIGLRPDPARIVARAYAGYAEACGITPQPSAEPRSFYDMWLAATGVRL